MMPRSRLFLSLCVVALAILFTPYARRSVTAQKNGARAELDHGRALLRRSQADQALGHLDSALQLYQQAGNSEGKGAANDALGDLYATQGQYQTALNYYQEAQKSFRDANKGSNASVATVKIADVYMRMGNIDSARQAFTELDSKRKNSGGGAAGVGGVGGAGGGAGGGGGPGDSPAGAGTGGTGAGGSHSAGGGGGSGLVNSAGLAGGALACAALSPPQIPFQGIAPKAPDALGRMDLRVVDQNGNAVDNASVTLESIRPNRMFCTVGGTTDALGRLIPEGLHVGKLTLKINAKGYEPFQQSLSPESLGQPVQATLKATNAAVSATSAAAVAAAKTIACLGLYQELVSQVAGMQGLGMAELLGNQLAASRGHFESLLGSVTGGGGGFGGFGVSKRARVSARTSLGDIAFLEGRYTDALKLYGDAIKGAREDGRLDLVWAAQRGVGRTDWKLSATETDKNRVWKLRMDGINSYREAIKTIETIRRGSLRADDARTTFSSSTKDVFDEAAAALIEMAMADTSATGAAGDLQGQSLSYASEAFSIIEQGRARALLEMLDESRAQITEGVPPELLKQRSDNLQRQQEIADQLFGLRLSDDARPSAVADLDAELERLSTDFDRIENQIVAASPRYAALAAPRPLSVSDLQGRVLDDRTVLLEYNLGSEQSILWAVTRTGLHIYRLPGRKAVEELTIDFRKQLVPEGASRPIAGIDVASDQGKTTRGLKVQAQAGSDSSSAFARSGFALYKAVVAPAVSQLADKRLLVVADGSLNYVPFEAMVTSESGGSDYSHLSYLINDHEIVYAPSATVVAAVRERAKSAAPRTALVVADPVFDATDPRAGGASQVSAGVSRGLAVKTALSDVKGTPVQRVQIPRLDGTRVEAEKIAQLAKTSGGSADVWLDLEANESRMLAQDLKQYGIVHIATHGLLDAEHPQFTGLVLSLVGDRDHDGFLRAQEVFNLRLSGSLVMLSACETGLGKEKRGEGVIGLTRAFLYAGTPLVGVSLWSVADDSTAELMTSLYQAMLTEKKPAAVALRDAQLKMISGNRFNAPFFWAPFVLIGDWKN